MSNFQEIITNGTYHEDGNIQTAEIAVIDALTFATGKNPRLMDLDRIGTYTVLSQKMEYIVLIAQKKKDLKLS